MHRDQAQGAALLEVTGHRRHSKSVGQNQLSAQVRAGGFRHGTGDDLIGVGVEHGGRKDQRRGESVRHRPAHRERFGAKTLSARVDPRRTGEAQKDLRFVHHDRNPVGFEPGDDHLRGGPDVVGVLTLPGREPLDELPGNVQRYVVQERRELGEHVGGSRGHGLGAWRRERSGRDSNPR